MDAERAEGPIPGPNPELMAIAGGWDAIRAVLSPRKWERFLDGLEEAADEYERLGSVVRLHGVSPLLLGSARTESAAWVRAYVRMRRRPTMIPPLLDI